MIKQAADQAKPISSAIKGQIRLKTVRVHRAELLAGDVGQIGTNQIKRIARIGQQVGLGESDLRAHLMDSGVLPRELEGGGGNIGSGNSQSGVTRSQ